jgi:hypothetical protein
MQLVAAYRTGEGAICLQECLPPSEYGMYDCVCMLTFVCIDYISKFQTYLKTKV